MSFIALITKIYKKTHTHKISLVMNMFSQIDSTI